MVCYLHDHLTLKFNFSVGNILRDANMCMCKLGEFWNFGFLYSCVFHLLFMSLSLKMIGMHLGKAMLQEGDGFFLIYNLLKLLLFPFRFRTYRDEAGLR